MANLLKETLEVLDNLGIKEEEVIYVVNREKPKDCKFMTWEMFKDIARYKTYDEGLGTLLRLIPILSSILSTIFYTVMNTMEQKDGKKSQHQNTCMSYYLVNHQKYSLSMVMIFTKLVIFYNNCIL